MEDERLHCQFVNRLLLSEKEVRIRAILFGLAVRCREYEEVRRMIGELKTQNKMHTTQKNSYDSNTQYALEA